MLENRWEGIDEFVAVAECSQFTAAAERLDGDDDHTPAELAGFRLNRAPNRERALRINGQRTVFEAEADFVPTLLEEATARMAAAAQLSVPLVVDSGVGDNWEEAH